MSKISVVLPLYNERESLAELHAELCRAFENLDVEFVFIDDGSDDGSWSVLTTLAESDPRIAAIRLRRNFGKAAALSAGFRESSGEILITMDADLQDNPSEVPRFLDAITSGLDVVSGWKQTRHDPWHKVMPSRLFNWTVSTITGCILHDHNCGFKAYRRAVIDEIEIYGELHRFIPVLAHARGFDVGELVVNHRPRRFGRSKYGVTRLIKGLLDLVTVRFLTRFGQRPLHLFGTLGLLLCLLGGFGLAAFAIAAIAGKSLPFAVAIGIGSAIAAVIGVHLLAIGLLAELLTSFNFRPGSTYSVAQKIASRSSSSIDEGRPPHV